MVTSISTAPTALLHTAAWKTWLFNKTGDSVNDRYEYFEAICTLKAPIRVLNFIVYFA